MLYLSCRLNTTRLQDQLTDQYSTLATVLDELIVVLATREDEGAVQPLDLDNQATAGKNEKKPKVHVLVKSFVTFMI